VSDNPMTTPDRGQADSNPNQRMGGSGSGSFEAVKDLKVPVSIELGRTRMSVEEIMGLGKGSVLQLDRLVGQPVDVFVSDTPFATGEVVVIGDKFGVRILRLREGHGGVGDTP
jgi:flagellar motor switch protein FliN/FliY